MFRSFLICLLCLVGCSESVYANEVINKESEVYEVVMYVPSFKVMDKDGIWSRDTVIDVFDKFYKSNSVVTVKGNENVVAPGTYGEYIFKLKNKGNVAMDYVLDVKVNSDIELPIEYCLTYYDGREVGFKDTGTIAEDCYVYYVFNWKWKFDGDDKWDTLLGNMEDIDCKVVFSVKASVSDEVGSGIVDTGDSSNVYIWYALLLCSFLFALHKYRYIN